MPDFIYASPIGALQVTEEDQCITRLCFAPADTAPTAPDTPLLCRAAEELDEYFAGTRQSFTLPLRAQGTAFQMQVWAALSTIPYGRTRSYAQMAEAVGQPWAYRAVGTANHKNPLPIFLPCHRVVGADGSLTGYVGGLEAKAYLLALERGGQ